MGIKTLAIGSIAARGATQSPIVSTDQSAATFSISAPVGLPTVSRCINLRSDVLAVQHALNQFTPIDGGPMQRLVEDGIFGPLTQTAILRFQNKWSLFEVKNGKGIEIQDGIVDPDEATIKRLGAGPGAAISADGEFLRSHLLIGAVLVASFQAMEMIVNFFKNTPGNIALLLSGDPLLIAFERNFHASRSSEPLNLAQFVRSKIILMGAVHQQLSKTNNHLLQIDFASDVQRAIAFCFPGGHFLSGPGPAPFQRHDMHKIFFGPSARALDNTGIAYAICHELGHYVDLQSDDFAYFHRDEFKYNHLSPVQARHNADSYSQFMFECAGIPRLNILDHIIF